MLVRVPHPQLGHVTLTGATPKLSRTPGRIRHVGAALGADTQEVLASVLGLAAEDVAALAEAGVVGLPRGPGPTRT